MKKIWPLYKGAIYIYIYIVPWSYLELNPLDIIIIPPPPHLPTSPPIPFIVIFSGFVGIYVWMGFVTYIQLAGVHDYMV